MGARRFGWAAVVVLAIASCDGEQASESAPGAGAGAGGMAVAGSAGSADHGAAGGMSAGGSAGGTDRGGAGGLGVAGSAGHADRAGAGGMGGTGGNAGECDGVAGTGCFAACLTDEDGNPIPELPEDRPWPGDCRGYCSSPVLWCNGCCPRTECFDPEPGGVCMSAAAAHADLVHWGPGSDADGWWCGFPTTGPYRDCYQPGRCCYVVAKELCEYGAHCAGSGGGGGYAGAAGRAGAAGSAGVAAGGGAAGTAGVGGSAGNAGSGGVAGTAGAGGR